MKMHLNIHLIDKIYFYLDKVIKSKTLNLTKRPIVQKLMKTVCFSLVLKREISLKTRLKVIKRPRLSL